MKSRLVFRLSLVYIMGSIMLLLIDYFTRDFLRIILKLSIKVKVKCSRLSSRCNFVTVTASSYDRKLLTDSVITKAHNIMVK